MKMIKLILQNFAEKCERAWKKKFDEILLKYWRLSGAKACKSCRSPQELSNEYDVAKFCVDTEENEPSKVWSFGWEIRVSFDIEPFNWGRCRRKTPSVGMTSLQPLKNARRTLGVGRGFRSSGCWSAGARQRGHFRFDGELAIKNQSSTHRLWKACPHPSPRTVCEGLIGWMHLGNKDTN